MMLILSQFHPKQTSKVIYAVPNREIPREIENRIHSWHAHYPNIDNLGTDHANMIEDGPFLAYFFDILADPEVGYEREHLILTLYLEDHENPHLFHDNIYDIVEKLIKIPDIAQAFIASTAKANMAAFKILGQVIEVLTEGFLGMVKLHDLKKAGLAEVLIVGLLGAGKSSIVNFLIHGKFLDPANPALTPRLYHFIYKDLDFRVIDDCCQGYQHAHFEKRAPQPREPPKGLVYVVDVAGQPNEHLEDLQEFKMWIDALRRAYSLPRFQHVPILVLFNKVDQNPDFDLARYQKWFHVDHQPELVEYRAISVKEGLGVAESFQWLVKNLKIASF